MAVNAVPEGYHTVTPYLLVADARAQLRFLKAVFDAKVLMVMPPGADVEGSPHRIMHVAVEIGDSRVMMGEAGGPWKAMAGGNYVYVADVDAVYARALADLVPGEAGIAETATGFSVVVSRGRGGGGEYAFEDVAPRIRQQLAAQRAQELFVERLRNEVYVDVRREGR